MINREDEEEEDDRIMVIAEDYDFAFSRGLLAHELGQRGLSLDRAYEVAKNVYLKLLEKDIKEIDENDLRRYVRSEALKLAGIDVAVQYDIIEKWHLSPEPIIILIAGARGTQTDIIGTELSERLAIPRIVSTESVTHILKKMISADLAPELHQKSYRAYTKLRPVYSVLYDKVLIGFEEHSRYPAEAVEALVKRALIEGLSMIIQGEHLVPRFLSEELIGNPNVIFVTIRIKDKKLHQERYLSAYSKKTKSKKEPNFEYIRKIHDYLVEESKNRGHKVIKVDKFNKAMRKIYEIALNRISEVVVSKSYKEYRAMDTNILNS
jgi:2-phosphoglycerate kinase